MTERVALAATEWRLMQIIWDKHPITFREICDRAQEQGGWSKYAVASFLKRMEGKGAIVSADAEPVKLYSPLLDREDAIEAETADVIERVYNNNPVLMAQAMARQQGLSDEELEQLTALLRKGGKRHG